MNKILKIIIDCIARMQCLQYFLFVFQFFFIYISEVVITKAKLFNLNNYELLL